MMKSPVRVKQTVRGPRNFQVWRGVGASLARTKLVMGSYTIVEGS